MYNRKLYIRARPINNSYNVCMHEYTLHSGFRPLCIT